MKSPKIRFKNAQGADFPDWSQDSLGSLCQMYQPATLSKQSLDESGPYAVYGANGIIGKHSQFNHAEAEVVVSCRGNCGSVQMTKPCSWINGNAMVVHPKDEKLLEKKFLNYLLSGQNFKSLTTGGAQPQITRGQLSNLSVFFPSCQEQQKIASFFSTLDQKRELNERKLEVLEKLKKGLMQKIFTREIRFKKEDGVDFPDWKIVSLGSVVKAKGGARFPLRLQNEETNEVPFFKVSDLNKFENRMYLSLADKFISFETAKKEKYHYFNEKGVVLAKVGAALMLERKRIAIPPFLIDNNLMALFPNELININFLYFLCLHINFSSLSQVGAIPSISANKVERLNIELPSMEEQERISSFFVKLDERISLCRDKLETFKVLKKGLMQQMFA